jgi:hypothetical protein
MILDFSRPPNERERAVLQGRREQLNVGLAPGEPPRFEERT